MKKKLSYLSLLMSFVFVSPSQAVQYTLQGLGDLPGGRFESATLDINDRGQVVGHSNVAKYIHAFLWDPETGMQDLGVPAGYVESSAYGINDRGEIAGYVQLNSNTAAAFFWTPTAGFTVIPDLAGGADLARGRSLNNSGQISGSAEPAAGRRAFLWDAKNGMRDLGTIDATYSASLSYDLNNAGQVIGRSDAAGRSDGFLWDPQTCTMRIIDDLPGGIIDTTARRINDAGQVVGNASSTNGIEAFLWDPVTGSIGLGDLPGGTFESRAFGVNNQGVVVGTGMTDAGDAAFIWDAVNGMRALADLIVDGSAVGWNLTATRQINNKGQIIGHGTNPSGNVEAFIATPVPTCP